MFSFVVHFTIKLINKRSNVSHNPVDTELNHEHHPSKSEELYSAMSLANCNTYQEDGIYSNELSQYCPEEHHHSQKFIDDYESNLN